MILVPDLVCIFMRVKVNHGQFLYVEEKSCQAFQLFNLFVQTILLLIEIQYCLIRAERYMILPDAASCRSYPVVQQ